MANYKSLKTTINANVKRNGNQEITGSVLNSVLNAMVDTLGTGYSFAGVATPATNPGIPDAKVFYIANGKGSYTHFGELEVTEDEVVVLYWDTLWHKVSTGIAREENLTNLGKEIATKQNALTDTDGGYGQRVAKLEKEGIASQEKLTELDSKTNEIKNSVQDLDGDTFYVTDAKGNVVAKIDAEGVKAIEVIAQGKKLSEMPNVSDMKIASILEHFYEDKLYVVDAQGNVVFHISKDGLHTIDVHCDTLFRKDWSGKTMATYGDSVTAINNGNWEMPYVFDNTDAGNGVALKNWMWGNRVASYFCFKKHYGRGFGGQWWKWNTTHKKTDGSFKLGGDLCKFNTITGCGGVAGGTDVGGGQYDYDDYLANPSIISLGQNEVACRGSLCSWNRIQTCFPVNIKDTIDLVMVINHNDSVDDGEITWVDNSNVDTEWSASGSNYYGKVNGDYNIDTLKGAIASTIMKLQMWMPQAIIVVCTPISGNGATGQLNKTGFGLYPAVTPTKDACLKMSIPCIDVFGTDGINGMNRTSYIADGIHPYTKDGSKMIARAIIGGLKCIEPKDLFND